MKYQHFPAAPRSQKGFTLLELMISIAIVAIIGAITFPLYTDYVQTSQQGVLMTNMSTIQVFQEDFRLRTGSYAVDLANKAAIETAIGWEPRDAADYTYSIADSNGTFYRITGIDGDGNTLCVEFPSNVACP